VFHKKGANTCVYANKKKKIQNIRSKGKPFVELNGETRVRCTSLKGAEPFLPFVRLWRNSPHRDRLSVCKTKKDARIEYRCMTCHRSLHDDREEHVARTQILVVTGVCRGASEPTSRLILFVCY
jgi:hypothetical protein